MTKIKVLITMSILSVLCLTLCAWHLQDWFKEIGIKEFAVVDQDQIYRSGLPTIEQLEYLRETYDIATVISLSGDVTERYRTLEQFLEEQDFKHVNLPMMNEAHPPLQQVTTFLHEMGDSNNWPILVHCGAGVDRTGMMIALHRIVNDNWQWERARDEAIRHGFHDDDSKKKEILEAMPEIAVAYAASNKTASAASY